MSKIIENINSTNQSSIKEDVKFKTKKPSMYRVLMLNDDYTPMDFVVFLLKKIFNKHYEFKNINRAIEDFKKGAVIRPIIKMKHI